MCGDGMIKKNCPPVFPYQQQFFFFLTVEEASVGNTEGKFMKMLQTWKNITSTELSTEPERR
jgi:hypothetical protein